MSLHETIRFCNRSRCNALRKILGKRWAVKYGLIVQAGLSFECIWCKMKLALLLTAYWNFEPFLIFGSAEQGSN